MYINNNMYVLYTPKIFYNLYVFYLSLHFKTFIKQMDG